MTFIINPKLTTADTLNSNEAFILWQVHPNTRKSELVKLNQLGINTVQSFSYSNFDINTILNFHKLLKDLNMKSIPYIGIRRKDEKANCKLTEEKKVWLKKLAIHDVIYAWHTFDEPRNKNYASKKCQLEMYKSVKSIFPRIPVFISLNNTRQRHYNSKFSVHAADTFGLHAYGNPYPGGRQKRMIKLAEINIPRNLNKEILLTVRAWNDPDGDWHPITDTSIVDTARFYNTSIRHAGIGFYGWELNPFIGLKRNRTKLKQLSEAIKIHKNKPQ